MSNLKKDFISKEDFEASCFYGSHYEGFVDDIGYVYWGKMLYKKPQPSEPNQNSIYVMKGTSFVADDYVPIVIPEDDLMSQVKLSSEDVIKSITKIGADGSIIVTFFDGTQTVLGKENSKIDITIADEYFDGKTCKVLTIRTEDKVAGKVIENKTSLKTAIKILGEGAGYASYIVGPLAYNMGKHMAEVNRFRPIVTTGGETLFKASSRYKYGFIPGKVASPLAKGLKFAGPALGVIGIGYTAYQYSEGEISEVKAAADIIFGVVGFIGLPGMIISLSYFMLISPCIDAPRPSSIPARDWNDISFPRDNTTIVNRYEPLIIPPRR